METEIGRVKHFYSHINVAVLSLQENLKLGDLIHILGHSTDIIQRVSSMQIEHHAVVWVKPGDDVAVKVIEPVHEHDIVYRIVEGIPEPIR